MSIVQVNGLKKSFQGLEIIKGLDFNLEEGKCIALLGPNGAGKTTTLRMLSGLMKPSTGTINFQNKPINDDIRKYIGYLSQYPVFYDWMTGLEFLEYVGKLGGLSNKEAKTRSLELLELVGIIDAKNRKVGKYSGGMRQRLGIAQAIIHQPQLLMLDEPVSALDPFGRREVLELLEKLKKQMTILFSTHILNDAEEVCDEILFLHNGLIVESGTLDDLKNRHQKSMIDLEFKELPEKYISQLNENSIFISMNTDGNRVSLLVTNLEEAKKVIFHLASVHDWPLTKFEISRLTLEDLFMEVVQK
ncbi:ATP-binding cassette domain-containing protein [Bacillus sp. CGMCC 1.16607]|uniref:ABC transporter ATP-binding protein n=1 Tax=Bacillus sp. CGMCC 1.16607 TaxID=3351842 RepID=UPI0036310ABB